MDVPKRNQTVSVVHVTKTHDIISCMSKTHRTQRALNDSLKAIHMPPHEITLQQQVLLKGLKMELNLNLNVCVYLQCICCQIDLCFVYLHVFLSRSVLSSGCLHTAIFQQISPSHWLGTISLVESRPETPHSEIWIFQRNRDIVFLKMFTTKDK